MCCARDSYYDSLSETDPRSSSRGRGAARDGAAAAASKPRSDATDGLPAVGGALDGDGVLALYSSEHGALSLEKRLALAEACLKQLHTLNTKLSRELAVFKDKPSTGLESLLLDVGSVSVPGGSASVSGQEPAPRGRRARSAEPNAKSTRKPRASDGYGRRNGREAFLSAKSGPGLREFEAERAKLVRAFNLKLHHAEQDQCETAARAAVLQHDVDRLTIENRQLSVRCAECRVQHVHVHSLDARGPCATNSQFTHDTSHRQNFVALNREVLANNDAAARILWAQKMFSFRHKLTNNTCFCTSEATGAKMFTTSLPCSVGPFPRLWTPHSRRRTLAC